MNWKICIIVCMALFVFTGTAMAHKVTVFAWVEGNTVYGEGKFSGGKKAIGAEVIVSDAKGNELLRTKTDENGEFSYPVPEKTEMHIALNAGMGHQAEWTIPLEELGEVAIASDSETALKPAPDTDAVSPEGNKIALPDTARLESIIEKSVNKALDKRLRPVMMTLSNLEDKGPSVNDILGGIGYILGLMGVGAYVNCRRKQG